MDTNKSIWPLRYVPAPELPYWAARALSEFGGRSPTGLPNFRFQWGMDSEVFMNGDPHARLYANPNDTSLGWACWFLEQWAGPEFFDQKSWEENRYGTDPDSGKLTDHLGPFPRQGGYIGIKPLVTDDYEFIPISQALVNEVLARLTAGQQTSDVLGALEMQRRLKETRRRERVEQQLEERREHYRKTKDNPQHTSQFVLGSGMAKGPSLSVPDPQQIARAKEVLRIA